MRAVVLLASLLATASGCGGRIADQAGLTNGVVDSVTMSSSQASSASSTRSAMSTTTQSASDTFADAAPPPFDASGLTTCASCLALTCQDLLVQCQQSTACSAVYECTVENPGSFASCGCSAPPEALGPFAALERCLEGVACGGAPCAPLCTGMVGCESAALECAGAPASSAAACDACVAASCAPFSTACENGSDCEAYVACLTTCSTVECETDCAAGHPTGQTAAQGLDVCLGGACQSACSY